MPDTAETKMQRARVHLLLRYPFYASLAAHLDDTPSERYPTAATDGTRLYYNPQWIEKLDQAHVEFVLSHEVLHCAFRHLTRCGTRELGRWNVAADYSVNAMLLSEGMQGPPGLLVDKALGKLHVEEIYERLPKNPTGGQPQTLDDHGLWDEAGQGKSAGSDPATGESATGESAPGPVYDPLAWQQRLVAAASVARLQGRGHLPGDLESAIEEALHPKLDWRVILRDFVQSSIKGNYRLFPPNKRYLWMPMYLPSMTLTEEGRIEVALAVDTSGSISDAEIADFVGEAKAITEQFEDYCLTVLLCDAAVQHMVKITPFEGELPKRALGRGGTDFRPVFDRIAKDGLRPSCLIYFTDLAGAFPDQAPPYPVLWLATLPGQAPFGEVVEYHALRRG